MPHPMHDPITFQFPNSLSEEIFGKRYTLYEGEGWRHASKRLAEQVAVVEKDVPYWTEEFYNKIVTGEFCPGGRIWYGSGRRINQLLNCFVIPVADSREGWAKLLGDNLIISGTGGGSGTNYCMSPDTRVLTQDFKWVRIDELQIGEKLIAPEEYSSSSGRHSGRHLKSSVVLFSEKIKLPSYRINTSKGAMVVSSYHPILARKIRNNYKKKGQGFNWVNAENLTPEYELAYACEPWEIKQNKNFNWFGGILDGEGCLSKIKARKRNNGSIHNAKLSVGQNKGLVFDAIGEVLNNLEVGYGLYKNSTNNCYQYQVRSKWDAMKVISMCPTVRLWPDRDSLWNGTLIRGRESNAIRVESIEYVGITELIALQTSTSTFIGEGFFQHNSTVRPRGTAIEGTGGEATGAVSLMRIDNGVDEEIKGGAGRRAAKMKCLNLDHPDLEEFLNCKLDLKQLNNSNISVIFNSDPKVFFDKVNNNEDWDLIWNSQVVKTVKARDIWEKIISNFLKNGEPGLLNGYLANRLSNIYYCRELVATNPCGEIFMQPYSTCCLGAIVLPKFVRRGPLYGRPPEEMDWVRVIRHRIDWQRLYATVQVAVRFLDDVLDATHYPTAELKQESHATRRISLGTMGVHDMLLGLGLKYSSEMGRFVVDRVMEFIKNAAYDQGVNLAIEKGVFPEYDAEKFNKSKFVNGNLKDTLRSRVKHYGVRNCAYLTEAPNGTTGMVMGVSTGCEPHFANAYWRTWLDVNHKKVKEAVVSPIFKEFIEMNLPLDNFEDSSDIHPEDHLKMQYVFQQHIDNAVSKTINIPKGKYSQEEFSALIMEWIPKLKGITVYPEGSRDEQPLERMSNEEAIIMVRQGQVIAEANFDCASGTCSL